MPPSQTPHRTPLRRVSQGSLFRLSRSNAYPDAPHGLGFLEPAMAEFLDETEALQTNVEGLMHLSDTLNTFNEAFASWLYVMEMNALTVDFTQAPTELSFMLAKRRSEQAAQAAAEALEASRIAAETAKRREQQMLADKTAMSEADTTYAGNATGNTAGSSRPGIGRPSVAPIKKVAKGKISAKEKKERSIEIEKIVSVLPLEFRGSDPTLRRHMEQIIEGLKYSQSQRAKITDLVAAPDLNQARVNKCLIALVNRKIVVKENSTGTVLYHWRGIA